MKMIRSLVFPLLLLLLFLSAPAPATAVPGVMNYQGHVEVGGADFSGTGQFKFAVVNGTGTVSYWSNDGTSAAGSEPTAAVSLTVTEGRFAVLLGDVTLTNMTAALTPAEFANDEVFLRVWFDDGANGSQLLTPDRRIAMTPFALKAATADSLTSTATLNAGILELPITTASSGIMQMGANRILHAFGTRNFFAGLTAGNLTMTGADNTAVGNTAMLSNTTGASNTAFGARALEANTIGNVNTAIGQGAMAINTEGFGNTALGEDSLAANTTGATNTALGQDALRSNSIGHRNTAVGEDAMRRNTEGSDNTVVGIDALIFNTTGSGNIALGKDAGTNLTIGDHNIMIGNDGLVGESATMRIGDGGQTRAFVAGIRGVTTDANDAVAVVIDSNGQLGTVSSSRRYKQNIRPMQQFGVSERIQQLRPVTFEYKQTQNDGDHPVQFGLIAEEVAEVFPELAVFNEDGQPETVKYHLLAPLLLEEVQKQNRQLLERDARIEALEQRLERIEAALSSATPNPRL